MQNEEVVERKFGCLIVQRARLDTAYHAEEQLKAL
jgi:hypothetical protein